jgi:hypothetical protein
LPQLAGRVQAFLSLLQVLVPEVAIDPLDHSDAGSGHSGNSGYIIAGHQGLADPEVAEIVDGNVVPDLPDPFRRGNFLDPLKAGR